MVKMVDAIIYPPYLHAHDEMHFEVSYPVSHFKYFQTMSLYGEDKNAKRLTADSTSLADLKAELHRKKGEAASNKVKGNFRAEKINEGEKKNNIWSKKNTGLIMRMQRDMEKRKEEERSFERAKFMLEKKQRLYESMKAGKGNSSVADNFLVDFSGGGGREEEEEDLDGSFSYPASRPDEEWVEYTDALGRTRQCMKKDLKTLQRQDREMVRDEDQVGFNTEIYS